MSRGKRDGKIETEPMALPEIPADLKALINDQAVAT